MRQWFRAATWLLGACWALSGVAQETVGRLALVVGNARYPGQAALVNPIRDAHAVADYLKAQGFQTLQYMDLTTQQIPAVRQQLETRVGRNTVVFVYYAGHGVQIEGRNYLLPVNTRTDNLNNMADDSLYLGDVLSAIEKRRPKLAVVILDACRDNPFKSQTSTKLSEGLARVDPPSSTVVFYATRPGGVASDGVDGNGLFTRELLRAAQTVDMPIEVVFRRTSSAVYKASKGDQEPWVEGVIREEFVMSAATPSSTPTVGTALPAPILEPVAPEARIPTPVTLVAPVTETLPEKEKSQPTTPPVPWQVALRSVHAKLRQNDDDGETLYACEAQGCVPYKEWASRLNQSEALEALKRSLSDIKPDGFAKICEFDLEKNACIREDVKFTIVSPVMLFHSGFFKGVRMSETKVTKSGGLMFKGDSSGGSRWFGAASTRVTCTSSEGQLTFGKDRVDMTMSRSVCMGTVPSTVKMDVRVLMADAMRKQFIVKWELGMLGVMGGTYSAGIGRISME